MPNKSLSRSSLTTFEKYSSLLAGNTAFDPSSDFLLEEIVLSSSAASVTFSGLGAYTDYKHLQLRAVGRTDRSSEIEEIYLRLNGDTATNYSTHYLRGNGAVVNSGANSSVNYIRLDYFPASVASANSFGSIVCDILDFSSSSKNTTARTFGGYTYDAGRLISINSGAWYSTSAVTSFEVATQLSNNFIAGSRFSLYGSKG